MERILMGMSLPLRIKYICGRHGRTLIAVLVLLSALGFATAITEAVTPPEQTQITEQTDRQIVETSLESKATVAGNSSLYEQNETLSNNQVYLLEETPNLTVIAVTEVPNNTSVGLSQQIGLELTATRNGAEFWSERRTLATDSATVTDGRLRTETSVNMQQLVRNRLSEVEAAAGDVGRIRARLFVTTTYDTGQYTGRTNVSTPLGLSERAYELETPKANRTSHATPVTRTVNATAASGTTMLPGTDVALTGPLSSRLVFGVVALGFALVIWGIGRPIDDFERFRKRYEAVRYSEWVSRGKLPDTSSYARVPVETLVDLVDIAIDTENRVIYDDSQEVYAVVAGNLVYEFRDEDDDSAGMYEFGLAPIDGTAESTDQTAFNPESPIPDGGENQESRE